MGAQKNTVQRYEHHSDIPVFGPAGWFINARKRLPKAADAILFQASPKARRYAVATACTSDLSTGLYVWDINVYIPDFETTRGHRSPARALALSVMSQASEAPTIDDEDEFLYGSTNTEPVSGAIPSAQRDLPTVESTVDAKDNNSEDQSDSDDSDVEFIIDPNAPLVAPPPRISTTFAPATISTPPPKPAQTVAEGAAQTSTSAPPASTSILEDVPNQPPNQPAQSQVVDETSLGPEGPPPAAPSTGPHLSLDPSASDLHYPPSDALYDARTEAQKAQDLPPMTIYQVDIDSLPEKPWRRPGANLSDWFNYGFDERSWSLWCGKRHEMEQIREDLQPLDASESAGAPILPPGFSGGMPDFSALLGGGMLPPVPPPMQAWMNGMMPGGADAPPPVPIPVEPPMTLPEKSAAADNIDDVDEAPYEPQMPPEESVEAPARQESSRRHRQRSRPERDRQQDEQVRYTDRDMVHGMGDTLDYGLHAGDIRRHGRREATPMEEHHADHGRHHRPSRRERARQERRSGRGGQKRGAPDGPHENHEREHVPKRAHHGRSRRET